MLAIPCYIWVLAVKGGGEAHLIGEFIFIPSNTQKTKFQK